MKERTILNAILLAVLLTATLNVARQIYIEVRAAAERDRLYEESGGTIIACKIRLMADEQSRFYIELALIVAFVGSRMKSVKGKILYLPGISSVLVIYVWWWQIYSQIKEASETTIELPNVAHLYRANYWDVCIFVGILALLLWEIKLLCFRAVQPNNLLNPPLR
jgi:hypothetical protein